MQLAMFKSRKRKRERERVVIGYKSEVGRSGTERIREREIKVD